MAWRSIKKLKRLRKAVFRKGGGAGSAMAFIGFELSPITLWNEFYINFPIAYVGATAASFVSANVFNFALIFFYWLSNFAGLILLELGIETVLHKKRHISTKMILLDILGSILITSILVYLMHIHVIGPPKALLS